MLLTVAEPLGVKGGRVPPLTAKNLPKIGKKRGENEEKSGKNRGRISKKMHKSGRFFHFAPPDRQGWLCF